MLVDGKAIAAELLATARARVGAHTAQGAPTLAIITCAPNFETQKYLALKKRKADVAGVVLTIHELPASADTAEVVETIHEALATASGIVVQLPLPAHIDREAVLAAVPVTHDPDGFWYGHDERACASPVVVAISEIARTYDVSFAGRRVVVVGEGRLVGTPAAHFLRSMGAQVVVVGQDTPDRTALLQGADIIVTGAGKPGIITPELVREGVIIFDAGTSEDGGMLAGDVAPAVAEKALLFSPVPGGIGPVTVAALLNNVVELWERSWSSRG